MIKIKRVAVESIAIFIVKRKNSAQIWRNNFRVVDESSDPRINEIFINRDAQNNIAENFHDIAAKILNSLVNLANFAEMILSWLRFSENWIAFRVKIFKLGVWRG